MWQRKILSGKSYVIVIHDRQWHGQKASVPVHVYYLQPSLIFVPKARGYHKNLGIFKHDHQWQKASVFVFVNYLQPSLIFVPKAGAYHKNLVIVKYDHRWQKASVFVYINYFQPSLIFAATQDNVMKILCYCYTWWSVIWSKS